MASNGTATVSNSSSGVIWQAAGPVTVAIAASTVNVTDNSGRIEATNGGPSTVWCYHREQLSHGRHNVRLRH